MRERQPGSASAPVGEVLGNLLRRQLRNMQDHIFEAKRVASAGSSVEFPSYTGHPLLPTFHATPWPRVLAQLQGIAETRSLAHATSRNRWEHRLDFSEFPFEYRPGNRPPQTRKRHGSLRPTATISMLERMGKCRDCMIPIGSNSSKARSITSL